VGHRNIHREFTEPGVKSQGKGQLLSKLNQSGLTSQQCNRTKKQLSSPTLKRQAVISCDNP